MKIPPRLQPLVEHGFVEQVVRQLKSGKEAMVFVVICDGEVRCAKVYKEANKRGFRQSVAYTEGRKVKNSRQARAMEKGSQYGRRATKPPASRYVGSTRSGATADTTSASFSTASASPAISKTARSLGRQKCGVLSRPSSPPATPRAFATDAQRWTTMVGRKAPPPMTYSAFLH